jgi:two-component system alkaline phosphatase synthesis response regulator PhoP
MTGMERVRVLVVEDEAEIREILVSNLEAEGFSALALESGKNLFIHLENFRPSVILLDQVMPGKSGLDLIQEVRSNSSYSHTPIMVVTGLTSEDHKVSAFNKGADDYITKPFSIKELCARIQALVRRANVAHKLQQKNISIRDLVVDLGAHKVTLRGNEIQLTLTEFKILCELIKQSGQVLTRDSLRERALGNLNVTDRTIDVHMASLRKKLEHMGDTIETVRGVGYRMAN